jgi:hypothetical protein
MKGARLTMASPEYFEWQIKSVKAGLSELKTDVRSEDAAVRETVDRNYTALSSRMDSDYRALDGRIDMRTSALSKSHDALRDRMDEMFRALDEKIEQRTKR